MMGLFRGLVYDVFVVLMCVNVLGKNSVLYVLVFVCL